MCLMPAKNNHTKNRGREAMLALTIFHNNVAMKEGRAVQEHVAR